MSNFYSQLATHESSSVSLPSHPPNYQDIDTTNPPVIEQFEIDDSYYPEPIEQEPLLTRARIVTAKYAYRFNNKVISPLVKLIDPIYEGYKYFQLQYEKSILRLGNPLVVKRLLYVAFILLLLLVVSKYNTNDTIKGTSGGTFTNGKFYDVDMLEDSIKSLINPKLMKENLEYFSSMPHMAGTKGDLTLAKYIERYMINNGINSIEFNELSSFLNYPGTKVANQDTYVKLSDGSFTAKLYEEGTDLLAYNPNGLTTNNEQIEANYIYGNFGTLQDFKQLQDNNIDITDKIVLLNYGGDIPESTKLHYAFENHAKAVIFITPKFGDNHGVIQRENVGLTRMSPGDILTPGWASEDGYVTRVTWDKSEITPKIPSIPISYKDGEKLLSYLDTGVKFAKLFSGNGQGIPLQIKISNTNRQVHPIWNVVGSIEGREQSEKGVIIGAARDSSCFGTMSSNSGTVALLEMIKIFTSLQRKHQWSPTRSIYFISFDATEYNLAGSGEWVEAKRETLRKQGYLYVDLSDLISGDELSIKAHPFLRDVINTRLTKVRSNVKSQNGNWLNLFDLFTITQNSKISNDFLENKNYIPFINSVNLPSLEIKYKGVKYPKNSCFDTFENFEKLKIDTSMEKHSQLVEVISRIVLRFAEYPLIPYNFNDFGNSLENYIQDLSKFTQDIISKLDQPNKPIIHFENLIRSNNFMKEIGRKYEDWASQWQSFIRDSRGLEPSVFAISRRNWNDNMLEFNSKFLFSDLHPTKRPGYTNILFGIPFEAPEFDREYEWNTFPKIRQYLLDHDFGMVQQEMDRLAQILHDAANTVNDLESLVIDDLPRRLQQLHIIDNWISSITGEEWPPGLERLTLSHAFDTGNTLADLIDTCGWPGELLQLSIRDNSLTQSDILIDLPQNLKDLNISDNRWIWNYGTEFKFPCNLTKLNMCDCQIHELTDFRFPTSLVELDLSSNYIRKVLTYASWDKLTNLLNSPDLRYYRRIPATGRNRYGVQLVDLNEENENDIQRGNILKGGFLRKDNTTQIFELYHPLLNTSP
ncbi:Uncharacterized protein TRE1 [Spathaspora sp. JA1]|nr:Uncharacterized protein TRE1 [Spathaspora sp. JA1]